MEVKLVKMIGCIALLFSMGQAQAQLLRVNQPFRQYDQEENGIGSFRLEPFGAEELRDADNKPRIPEPMVFDLVRPLGARKGETEINVLSLVPYNQRSARSEWAPEFEWAVADGVALEFELPFEDWTLESYKMAGQLTFGTAFNDHFIHGCQSILLYDRRSNRWSPTLLYIAGVQFDDYWSALVMAGLRTGLPGDDRSERTESLFNFSVFRHLSDYVSAGLESNSSTSLSGKAEHRLMPQLHLELQDHIMLQLGSGCLFSPKGTIPESALRLIYNF